MKRGRWTSDDHKLILEHIHAGVAIHDSETRILYASPAAHKTLGLSPDEMLGKKDIYLL